MKSNKYPQTIYLTDVDNKPEEMPLQQNVVGEVDVEVNGYKNQNKKKRYITLESLIKDGESYVSETIPEELINDNYTSIVSSIDIDDKTDE